MKPLQVGEILDVFEIGKLIHAGAMAHIYEVKYSPALGKSAPFPMVMKVPRMGLGAASESIVSFEVELQILSEIKGPHAPRYVASGDLKRTPYLVMEHLGGSTLQDLIDSTTRFEPQAVASIGAALAHAAHNLHQQNICHLDLKPANALLLPDQTIALIDFGLSHHALYPDLLAEESREAVGSPAWIAPEQVVGIRGDPRSDIFAIGVILFEMITGELPYGNPQTKNGLRNRLWMDPIPPRKIRKDIPDWLQEIILRCLEPEGENRYPSAAHLAFDLTHFDQIKITERGLKTQNTGFKTHFMRWFKAAGLQYKPSPPPAQEIDKVPIIMVAVPHHDVSEATLYSLREATTRSLGIRPGARLSCVTVISPRQTSISDDLKSETSLQRQYLAYLQQWAGALNLEDHRVSFHVLESSDAARTLLQYAETNKVSMIIMGAATHGLKLRKFITSIPIRVAMRAPCTVILVKQNLPFQEL